MGAVVFPAVSAGETLPGLSEPVRIITDRESVPHLFASDDLDLARAQGFVHARDRFFQMDVTRRVVSGYLAELFGASVLGGDVANRTIGLRRAAQRSAAQLSERERAILQSYADGVNAYLASHPLPVEYGLLELSAAHSWSIVDSLVIGKAIAASLSLDIDTSQTLQLQEYVEAGAAAGFDGEALFFEDVRRSAPMDPASTVPDATSSVPFEGSLTGAGGGEFLRRVAAGAGRAEEMLAQAPRLAKAMDRRDSLVGSNEWGVAAEHSSTGLPLIANDPHLSLDAPSTFYEIHLVVDDDPEAGEMNVSGVGFPGIPGVILGQNENITWGATTNPMDVSDVFADQLLVLRPRCLLVGGIACIISEGKAHKVELEIADYRVNLVGDGVLDNLVDSGLPFASRVILTVPFRSFGPVIDLEDPPVITGGETPALVLQFTGFYATRELRAFQTWNRAKNLDDFKAGLASFDFGSQNWSYADADGNLAYFTSGELPLRRDLEEGTIHGTPPFFVRDGSGPANWLPDWDHTEGQWIPFAVMPFEEMPHAINPENGFFVNANNDPAGVTLDNNPLNQTRPSKPGAIYYLNPGYANGLRAGRITRLIRDRLDDGKKISISQMMAFQANTQQLDAELMTPFLLEAFANALREDAPSELQALAADAGVAEAVGRLADWDFSTPTGIPEGWDARDTNGNQTYALPRKERLASVAATIYNVWRAKLIRQVVDARLADLGVSGVGSSDALKAVHHLLSSEPFTGFGASGVDFFPEPAGLSSAEDRRDATLLGALRTALDALASDDFAEAFGNSTKQSDYRWGRLHRITFDHPLGAPFSIPPAAGFDDLAPGLPGLSRDGGYEVVNASGFSARADRENSFRFGSGPVRRYVGEAGRYRGPAGSIRGFNVIPGGSSGDPSSPLYATQLGKWLTADYHKVVMTDEVAAANAVSDETLVPGAGNTSDSRRRASRVLRRD
jgi:penicillin amidase